MRTRADLHQELVSVLGSNHVYFQPPETTKLIYPCIVYNLSSTDQRYADDKQYKFRDRYDVTIITKDPELSVRKMMAERFQLCSFDRRFVSDNLYHDVFTLYW